MNRFALASIAFLAASPALADVTIGNPPLDNIGNCFPFSCEYNGNYQQIYGAGAFSGPLTITGLRFYNTEYNSGSTELASGTWSISLSTSSTPILGLSSNPANNIGVDNTLVFTGDIGRPWSFGDTLDIAFTTGFTYDPGLGNLLVDINASGLANGADIFFDETSDNTFTRRNYNGSLDSLALVTTFVTGPAPTPTPEPASVALLAGAVLGLAASRRRRPRA